MILHEDLDLFETAPLLPGLPFSGVQPDEVGIPAVGGLRRLEDDARQGGAHGTAISGATRSATKQPTEGGAERLAAVAHGHGRQAAQVGPLLRMRMRGKPFTPLSGATRSGSA